MRNFVEHQERARQKTVLLVVLMLLAVIAMGVAFYGLLLLLTRFDGGLLTSRLLRTSSPWEPRLLGWSVVGTAGIVGLASGSRMLSLRGSGAQVAQMLGGRLVSGAPLDALEKRLLNVVEEMAIASGVPVPQVFVLAEESGINAFAAGQSLGDAVIAVTGGALEKLTRDELQGVIAHEFSHLRNGDTRLNLRLMGVVFGILCIGMFGRLLLRAGRPRASGSGWLGGRGRNGGNGLLLGLGLGVLAVGLLGEFFGKLIKAAISREREFLADASAVQFTRNPDAVAGALKKIGGYAGGARLAADRAEEVSHFFFADIHGRSALVPFPALFRTHPELAERIRRVEPGFRGSYPEVAEGIAEQAESPIALGFTPRDSGRGDATSMPAQAPALDRGQQLLARIPGALRQAAESPFSAVAIAYALLLSERADVRAVQCAELDALSGAAMRSESVRLWPALQALPRGLRLPLVALLSPALHALSERQRAAFTRSLSALVQADHRVSLFEFVVTETLRERLADGRSPGQRTRVRHKRLSAVSKELALCLSVLAQASGSDRQGAARAFGAGAARLSGVSLAVLPASERLLLGLPSALAELRALAPELRAQVVDAATHCVMADDRVAEDEATLLCAVCDALDCPLPPFLAPQPEA